MIRLINPPIVDTITAVPTWRLMSESFKNWRGMAESGGRRIKKVLLIKKRYDCWPLQGVYIFSCCYVYHINEFIIVGPSAKSIGWIICNFYW